ncbi:MAG: hydrogenase maturation protein [Filomicrobium sp.]
MRILLLCHAFNSLTQRIFVELRALGHDVSVEFDINDATTCEAVSLFEPDLIIAPFLKRAIPSSVWQDHVCLVVHPGPVGDRGPAALDWAVLDGEETWGVTVLQAAAEMDAGAIWAHRSFSMRPATKSSLYRNEVTDAACEAILEAVEKFQTGSFAPRPLDSIATVTPRWRDGVRQASRRINWEQDDTATVLRKIASADGVPGCKDSLFGTDVFLYDAHRAEGLANGAPGTPLARSGGSVAVATGDGAVWIGRARMVGPGRAIKLPVSMLFPEEVAALPEAQGHQDIRLEHAGSVYFLHFPFYNGAMGTSACERLLEAYKNAVSAPGNVLVLMGGPDFWSNGLDLNLIEAADSPADESWCNINAIDDLAEAIIKTSGKIVISAMCGNAGAGGVFLARAADEVWMRRGVILNPHYKDMGNLYGSELWTYLLPRHAGAENARKITQGRLPMGAEEALALGLADQIVEAQRYDFFDHVRQLALDLASSPGVDRMLSEKADKRACDEAIKPLSEYRAEELRRMRRNFYGFDPSYHIARSNFVFKVPKSRTPVTIARHRDKTRHAQEIEKVEA